MLFTCIYFVYKSCLFYFIHSISIVAHAVMCRNHVMWQFKGILPKRPYPPCLRMADRALLAGYPRISLMLTASGWFWGIMTWLQGEHQELVKLSDGIRLKKKYFEVVCTLLNEVLKILIMLYFYWFFLQIPVWWDMFVWWNNHANAILTNIYFCSKFLLKFQFWQKLYVWFTCLNFQLDTVHHVCAKEY